MGFQGCSRVVSTCVLWLSTVNQQSGKTAVSVTGPLLYEKLKAGCLPFAPDFNIAQDFQSFLFWKENSANLVMQY